MAAPKAGPAPVVLVVDDEPSVLALMERTLAEAGYQVHVASGPLEALDLLNTLGAAPAVLVSDLRMQPLDGVVLAEQVLAKWPETRVLLVSAWDPEHPILHWPLLRKPFLPHELIEAVGHLLNGSARASAE
jgi:CheY-like chemotaxis protein